jgi:hypothetical protein
VGRKKTFQASNDMSSRLSAAAANTLSFRTVQSDSAPLFTALNLVYPGRVISSGKRYFVSV